MPTPPPPSARPCGPQVPPIRWPSGCLGAWLGAGRGSDLQVGQVVGFVGGVPCIRYKFRLSTAFGRRHRAQGQAIAECSRLSLGCLGTEMGAWTDPKFWHFGPPGRTPPLKGRDALFLGLGFAKGLCNLQLQASIFEKKLSLSLYMVLKLVLFC